MGVALMETATGRYLQVNPRLCEILGRTPGEVLASTWRDFTHPEDLDKDLASAARMAATGTPFRSEKRYRRKDGSVVWIDLTVGPVA